MKYIPVVRRGENGGYLAGARDVDDIACRNVYHVYDKKYYGYQVFTKFKDAAKAAREYADQKNQEYLHQLDNIREWIEV